MSRVERNPLWWTKRSKIRRRRKRTTLFGPRAPSAQPLELRPQVATFGKMRWRAISIIAAGAMIALSVFVFRPRPHDGEIWPPYAELISKQCAVAPENDLIPAECSCEKR